GRSGAPAALLTATLLGGTGAGGPRVGCRGTLRTALGTAEAAGLAALVEASAAPALGLVDLGGRVAQRGSDLVDRQLHDGALLALLGLERARLQAAGHDDARATHQGLGDVLSRLAPDGAAHEQRLAVLE